MDGNVVLMFLYVFPRHPLAFPKFQWFPTFFHHRPIRKVFLFAQKNPMVHDFYPLKVSKSAITWGAIFIGQPIPFSSRLEGRTLDWTPVLRPEAGESSGIGI